MSEQLCECPGIELNLQFSCNTATDREKFTYRISYYKYLDMVFRSRDWV
jgi:hypothetical protein